MNNWGIVCYTQKFAYFSSKEIGLSSMQVNMAHNLKFWYDSCWRRVLICKINTPLVVINTFIHEVLLWNGLFSLTRYSSFSIQTRSFATRLSNLDSFTLRLTTLLLSFSLTKLWHIYSRKTSRLIIILSSIWGHIKTLRRKAVPKISLLFLNIFIIDCIVETLLTCPSSPRVTDKEE